MPEAGSMDIATLLQHLGLGALREPAVVLKPGTFPVWKAVTSQGAFHVKAFSDGDWDWREATLAAAAEVERAAVAAGIDSAEPVVINVSVGGCRVTVHRWIDSRALDHTDDVHGWLGETLARLHTIPPPSSGPSDHLRAYHGLQAAEDWAAWADEAGARELPWAHAAHAALSDIKITTELVAEGVASTIVVGSHRDLLPQNILVSPAGRFFLIDWELAGPALPWPETIMAVMDIGRFAAGRDGAKAEFPEVAAASGILRGYLRAGGTEGALEPTALASVFGMVLGRICYSMWQSLGHRATTPAERQAASDYLVTALPRLRRRLDAIPHVIDSLSEAMGNARRRRL